MSMHILAGLVLLASVQAPEEAFLDELTRACASGTQERVAACFAQPSYASELWDMARSQGGLRALQVRALAAPPGRTGSGAYWAVLSARQDIESYHDMVFPIVRTGDGLRLGREIPEHAPDPYRIRHMDLDARLIPDLGQISVNAHVLLEGKPKGEAPMFRHGIAYRPTYVSANGTEFPVRIAQPGAVLRPKSGEAVRAGGLFVLWTAEPVASVHVRYDGTLAYPEDDKIDSKTAFVTAWWVPSIGRLPHTTATRITGPKDWTLISEGEPDPARQSLETLRAPGPTEQAVSFRCDIPISYPKIVGGKYKLAAELKSGGRTYRAYHLGDPNPARGEKDVALMAESIDWFEKNLGKFPFSSYACFDADTYYGIESYNYTLLRRDITTRFVTHEIGHTYFGGLVPCAYTKDSFNESFTQYVDSVLFRNNADGTLNAGLRTLNVAVPLNRMPVAHSYNSTTYYRGAYVLRMLEKEIGTPAMMESLRDIVTSRRGVETTWDDLLGHFVKTAKRDLTWFWDQWIRSADFPTIQISDARIIQRDNSYSTFVTVRYQPARVARTRFAIVLDRFGQKWRHEVLLDGNQQTFRIDTPEAPKTASIDVFGLTLAATGAPVEVKP